MSTPGNNLYDCLTELKHAESRYERYLSSHGNRQKCTVSTKPKENLVKIVCGKEHQTLQLPKTPLERCEILVQFFNKRTERAIKHESRTTQNLAPQFASLGWKESDISDKNCEPILTPEIHEFERCISDGDCSGTLGKRIKISIDEYHKDRDDERGKLLGSGVYRDTYVLGPKCVMKIANGIGVPSNLNEIHAWDLIKRSKNKNAIKLFAPIVSYHPSGAWLVMPRVDTTPFKREIVPDAWTWKGLNALWEKVRHLGIECDDLHARNLGYVGKGKNKRLIIIDYGGFKHDRCKIKPGRIKRR